MVTRRFTRTPFFAATAHARDARVSQLELDDFEVVGNYALRLQWFDGHGTGLYSYKYLRALCQCSACQPDRPEGASRAEVEHPDLPRV